MIVFFREQHINVKYIYLARCAKLVYHF